LNQIFDEYGLESDDYPLDAALGADGLGMDSQEIVELYGRLRQSLGFGVPPNSLRRTMTSLTWSSSWTASPSKRGADPMRQNTERQLSLPDSGRTSLSTKRSSPTGY